MAHVTFIRNLVKKQGGAVSGGPVGRWHRYNLESPKGMVWNASGTHALVLEWLAGDEKYREASILDAIDRVNAGASECDGFECEYCNPVEAADAC